MTTLRHHLVRIIRRSRLFGRAQEAVAAVEFALVLPVMLTLYLGSAELSQLINVDQRVNVIAGTVGDLVARANGSVTATNLTDYFQAATAIISPFSTTPLTQEVTLVYVASDGTTTVKWSRKPTGVGYTTNASFASHPLPSTLTNAVKGTTSPYIVVSEATYTYTPLLGLFFKNPFTLYHQNFYLPRYPGIICYNTTTCT
jgi:Flp pilus assembly protein TadG